MYLKNNCNDFMDLVVMVCAPYSSTISSLIISLKFSRYYSCLSKFMSTGLNYEI